MGYVEGLNEGAVSTQDWQTQCETKQLKKKKVVSQNRATVFTTEIEELQGSADCGKYVAIIQTDSHDPQMLV